MNFRTPKVGVPTRLAKPTRADFDSSGQQQSKEVKWQQKKAVEVSKND